MASKRKKREADKVNMFLARDPIEQLASIEGEMAMYHLHVDRSPGPKRFRMFHMLRAAARRCPNAAYNLAVFLGDRDGRMRRKRVGMAMELYARAVEMARDRLLDPDEPFDTAPKEEQHLRDVISRSLTNIGTKVSNHGRPESATQYFRDALRAYPLNPVSHVCLGNMGVWHSDKTGVSPMEGIEEWRKALDLGMGCHEVDNGCPCKENVVSIARDIEGRYGEEAASRWVAERYRLTSRKRKKGSEYVTVYRTAADAAAQDHGWTDAAARVADVLAGPLAEMRKMPLETKVTAAGALLGTLARLGAYGMPPSKVIEEALELADRAECLEPFLGDEEWKDLAPPETDHLLDKNEMARIVFGAMKQALLVRDNVGEADGVEMAMGLLFHVDKGFRRGIRAMVIKAVDRPPFDYLYVPAMFVGGSADN